MKPTIAVAAAALVNSASEILVAQRPDHKNMGGLWEFPGGKVEQGESMQNCLVRELKEELDIGIDPILLQEVRFVTHEYDKFNLLMFLYMIDQWEGEPKPLEHQALKWLAIDELYNLAMPPADLPLIAPLARLIAQRKKS